MVDDKYRTIEQRLNFLVQAREVHVKGLRTLPNSQRIKKFHTQELIYYNNRIIELMEESNAEHTD